MSKSPFLLLFLTLLVSLFFIPIVFRIVVHYDMNRKKFCFSLYLFNFIKIIGGYIATYRGGLAIHISKKKAIVLSYGQLEGERQRFSFIRTFHLTSFQLTTETGAEYLLPAFVLYSTVKNYFIIKSLPKCMIENHLWLADGDKLRLSLSIVTWFTLFILLKNFIKFLKKKMEGL